MARFFKGIRVDVLRSTLRYQAWQPNALIKPSYRLRIPVKWGTDSGDVGQSRSEATLVISMIGEVPHMSQESSGIGFNQHHFVSSFALHRNLAFR